jgi:uncharacterized protein (TIGR00369 family)
LALRRAARATLTPFALAAKPTLWRVTLDETEQLKWRARMRKLMVGTRFIESLGVTVVTWEPDEVVLRVPFDEKLTNDGKEYHGGAIAALMDTTGAAAVWAGHDYDKGLRASTVSMTVNYVGRAQGDLLATARCVKRGRDLNFSEIRVDDTNGTLVATGTLVYRVVP